MAKLALHSLPENVLAVVGHDLRTQLAVLQAATDDLSVGINLSNAHGIRQATGQIRSRTAWLQCQIDTLLTAEALRCGQFRLQPRLTDIVAWLCELQQVVEPLLLHKHQELRLARRGDMPLILIDPRRITQVLVTLIAHASQVTGADQPIDVTLTRQDRWVRITVADRGPGVPGKASKQLFRSANQATALGPPDEGVGLGVSRMIVEAHGGQVGAEPRRGGGACVWIEMPVHEVA
jgi:K+-sensing histidine kinase KdpD